MKLPPEFNAIASTENSPTSVIAKEDKFIGVQFHPEVAHTEYGKTIIDNFIHGICGCGSLWTPANFIEDTIKRLKNQIGSGKVICGLSGGVDSTVAAALVHRAVGDQLTCIFVDNGLMRLEEPERIKDTLSLIHI